jgi:hypothetical protein
MTYRHHIYIDARQIEPVSIVGGRRRHGCDVAEIRYLVEGSQHAGKEICVMYRDGVILTLRPLEDYYYRRGRLRPAYLLACQTGLCSRGDMPSRGGKEAVQSPRAIPPVQPAVRGVEMPGRRSKSTILRARDWLAAIASNKGSASAHITTWYRLLAGQHKICPKHTRASQDLRYLPVLYYTYVIVARSKVAPLSTPRVEISTPPIAPAETLTPFASLPFRHS